MKADPFVKTLLLLITIFLGLSALGQIAASQKVRAESEMTHRFYIEPGTTLLTSPDGSQNVVGKVVVDLTTGKIWGFPTNAPRPYPTATVTGHTAVVTPIYLGRFDLEATAR
jgi:hypothetical protein